MIGTRPPALRYPDHSALSARWPGVRIVGNPREDIDALIALGHLPANGLVTQ